MMITTVSFRWYSAC